jgi:1,4-alpha-glucan branching enzyme
MATARQGLAFVLHAHLPYVRSSAPGSLEEDWYFQALQECYLPLLAVLEAAAADRPSGPPHPGALAHPADRCWPTADLNQRFLPWLRAAPAAAAAGTRRPCHRPPPPGRAAGNRSRPSGAAARASWCPASAAAAAGGAGPDHLRRHPRLPAAAARGAGGGARPAAQRGARAHPPAGRAPAGHLAAGMRLLRGARPAAGWRRACATRCSMATACCTPCPGRATACSRRSARRRAWPSSAATATPPCRCGAPARATPATGPTGNSTATWAGICRRSSSARLGIRSRRPLGLKLHRVTAQGCPLEEKQPYEPEPPPPSRCRSTPPTTWPAAPRSCRAAAGHGAATPAGGPLRRRTVRPLVV